MMANTSLKNKGDMGIFNISNKVLGVSWIGTIFANVPSIFLTFFERENLEIAAFLFGIISATVTTIFTICKAIRFFKNKRPVGRPKKEKFLDIFK